MKFTSFAATGGVGRHLLDQAVAAGHQVTAAVRDPGRGRPAGERAGSDRLRPFTGPLRAP